MLYKENQDVLISVDVFASDRIIRGIIFSLLFKSFTEPVNKHIRLFLHSCLLFFEYLSLLKRFAIHRLCEMLVFFDFSLTVKAAPHECVIRTGQPKT